MFPAKIQNAIKLPLIIATVAVFIFGSFCAGIFHKNSTLDIHSNKNIVLPIGGEQPCCGGIMSISQHIQTWKNTFLAVPQYLRGDFVSMVLSLFLALAFLRYFFPNIQILSIKLKLYTQSRFLTLVFDPLKLAFADGICNTKLY